VAVPRTPSERFNRPVPQQIHQEGRCAGLEPVVHELLADELRGYASPFSPPERANTCNRYLPDAAG